MPDLKKPKPLYKTTTWTIITKTKVIIGKEEE